MPDPKLDYEQTGNYFRMLADIRLKLVVLVPTIAGTAVAWSRDVNAPTALATSLVGFIATLGVVLYELRNTQLYDAAMQRLRTLEGRLGFEATRIEKTENGLGGAHLERPGRNLRFFLLPVVHDHGLALIYGAALGAWVYMLAASALELSIGHRPCSGLLAALPFMAALLLGAGAVSEFHRIDRRLKAVRGLPSDVRARLITPGAQVEST